MKQLVSILMIFFLLSCKKDNKSISIDVSNDIVVPKHYIVAKIKNPLKIDGLVNEKSWVNAPFTDDFIDIEGTRTPKFKTRVKMLWDDTYLYVYVTLQEPHIWANLKQRDTIIFYNNDFEVFIDPSGEAKTYGEIEINTLNTIWDLLLNKPYRVGGKADNNWNLTNLKSAVNIKGTLNNPNDIDTSWSVEMAIPLKPYVKLKNEPQTIPNEGEQWRINFSRVEWNFDLINNTYKRKKIDNKYLKEYNWVWSTQKVINMHEPEKWGYLQFTEVSSAKKIKFIQDSNLLVKQTAFALFRKTKFGELKYLMKKEEGYSQIFKVNYAKNKSLKAHFYKTDNGFKFDVLTSQKIYSINQEGILKKL